MTTRKVLLATAALLLAAPVAAQTPIGSLDGRGVTIQGTVTDVFGNKFVLRDDSGTTLVEAGPSWYHRLNVHPGERVTVTGRPERSGFDAFSIVRENGDRIEVRRADGPPPWAGSRDWRGERDKRAGGDGRARASIALSDAEVFRTLAAAGYTDFGRIERKRRHVEVETRNRHGERVEVHVDADGQVYKERWLGRRTDRR